MLKSSNYQYYRSSYRFEYRRIENNIEMPDNYIYLTVGYKDCDLIGYPVRITIGPKTLEEGDIEVKVRKSGEVFHDTKENYLAHVKELLGSL